jgi:Protein of unknown function (DUF1566)
MRWPPKLVLVPLFTVAMIASAQSSTQDRGLAQETQVRGYWTDPSTGLTWAGKDNGRDVNWHKATKYCRDLRLAGYSDWRLATIAELQGIFDKSAEAPGLAGKHGDQPFSFHVKGNLFLTGDQWSSSQRSDDRGHTSGLAWYFDFSNGLRNDDDAGRFTGRFANYGRRALCVRNSGK